MFLNQIESINMDFDDICTIYLGRYIMYSQVSARQLFRAGFALHQSQHVDDVELTEHIPSSF